MLVVASVELYLSTNGHQICSRAYGTIVAFEQIGRIVLMGSSRDQLRLSAGHFIYCNLVF